MTFRDLCPACGHHLHLPAVCRWVDGVGVNERPCRCSGGTLREQVEALHPEPEDSSCPGCFVKQAVLDLIDAHRCLDPERLARALVEGLAWNPLLVEAEAERIIAAYEEN